MFDLWKFGDSELGNHHFEGRNVSFREGTSYIRCIWGWYWGWLLRGLLFSRVPAFFLLKTISSCWISDKRKFGSTTIKTFQETPSRSCCWNLTWYKSHCFSSEIIIHWKYGVFLRSFLNILKCLNFKIDPSTFLYWFRVRFCRNVFFCDATPFSQGRRVEFGSGLGGANGCGSGHHDRLQHRCLMEPGWGFFVAAQGGYRVRALHNGKWLGNLLSFLICGIWSDKTLGLRVTRVWNV